MGYFVAYRHTGAEPERLEAMLPVVRDTLVAKGEDVYCTYFDEANFKSDGFGPKQIMEHAFQKIEEQGNLLVVLDDTQKSEGMILEVGYCLAKAIPIVVARRRAVETYLDQMATVTFEYTDIPDLANQIKEVL